MNDPVSNISSVLKKVRFERGLTLEQTSNLTSVSKAMLGQIERGESNPTISILWKIATGLKISFSELLSIEANDYEPIFLDELDPVYEVDEKMVLYDVFPYNPISGFEYFYIKLLPGATHVSTPHENAKNEYVIVTKGTLSLTVDEKTFELVAPSALAFRPSNEHTYSNLCDTEVIFQNIVSY